MRRKYTRKHVALMLIGIGAFCFVMYMGLMLRDYNLEFKDGSLQFVSKTPIPVPASFQINNNIPGKLVVTVPANATASGFEVRYSLFGNMFFPKSYASSFLTNTMNLSMLWSGMTYHVQVRYYIKNSANRKVNGPWSAARPVKVR